MIETPSTRELHRRLARLRAARGAETGAALSPANHIFAGLETRTDPSGYYWDGERRGGNPAYPYMVIQYTLRGWGIYDDGQISRVSPEDAFFAVVPSHHKYYLPSESREWTFFYLIIRHPYAVSRLVGSVDLAGAVHKLTPNGPLLPRMVRIFESVYSGSFRDQFEEEEAVVDFAIEFDRHAHHTVYPQPPREKLLDSVRSFTMRHIHDTVDVAMLADEHGMTRSGFSHHFKAVTGLAPASFIRQVRLERAVQLLIQTDHKLDTVAYESGFASANDLCKVFRKHYHHSPTAFRKQMSPPSRWGDSAKDRPLF
jgi:AraC-like DNA-binding protein